MKFSIRVLHEPTNESGSETVEICLGDDVESAPLITTRWSAAQYAKQWCIAIKAIVSRDVQRCMLITDIQPPSVSAGLMYWALLREHDQIIVQERMMRQTPEVDLFLPKELQFFIPPRLQGNPDEHAQVSEWVLSDKELIEFLASPAIEH